MEIGIAGGAASKSGDCPVTKEPNYQYFECPRMRIMEGECSMAKREMNSEQSHR
jgi:hypothetical protein